MMTNKMKNVYLRQKGLNFLPQLQMQAAKENQGSNVMSLLERIQSQQQQ